MYGVSAPRQALEKASVLVVDDNPDTRALLQFLLEGEGLKVLTAEDGTEALYSLNRFRPDLILTDLAMPDMDGIELIKRVKEHAELNEIPIVALTAFRGNYPDAALSAGASVVLRKPDDFDRVSITIYQVLLNANTDSASNRRRTSQFKLTA